MPSPARCGTMPAHRFASPPPILCLVADEVAGVSKSC
jgi:hypothetical protein